MPHFYPPPNPPTLAVLVASAYPEKPLPRFLVAVAATNKTASRSDVEATLTTRVTSAKFRAALAHTLRWEGGFVAVDVKVSVGSTNYGVTQLTARAHGYQDHMRDIPMSVVERIYAQSYWLPQFEDLPLEIAVKVFDTGVNMGPGQAVKFLQRALGVKDTGRFDAATTAAAAALAPEDVPRVLESLRTQQGQFYERLIAREPAYAKYRRGWLRRAAS